MTPDQLGQLIADLLPMLIMLGVVTMILGLLSHMVEGMDYDPAPKKEKPKKAERPKPPVPFQNPDIQRMPLKRKAKRVTCAACGKRIKVPKPSQWTAETDTLRCPHCGTSYHPYALGVTA